MPPIRLSEAFVEVRARLDKLDADLNRATSKTQRAAGRMRKILAGAAGAAGIAGIGLFGSIVTEGIRKSDSGQELARAMTELRQSWVDSVSKAIDAIDRVTGLMSSLTLALDNVASLYRVIAARLGGTPAGIAIGDEIQRRLLGGSAKPQARGVTSSVQSVIGAFKSGQFSTEDRQVRAQENTAKNTRAMLDVQRQTLSAIEALSSPIGGGALT